jgi:RHS repeat-associated protein
MVSLTGKSTRWTSCTNRRRTYTGKTPDGVVGLYYYRQRVYHGQLGRFVSRDPVAYESWGNLLAYVADGPTTLVDPDGQWPLAPWDPNAEWWFGWENPFADDDFGDDVAGGCAECAGAAAPGGLGEIAGGLGCVAEMCKANNQENYFKRQMDIYKEAGPRSEYVKWKGRYERCRNMRERAARKRAEEAKKSGCCK